MSRGESVVWSLVNQVFVKRSSHSFHISVLKEFEAIFFQATTSRIVDAYSAFPKHFGYHSLNRNVPKSSEWVTNWSWQPVKENLLFHYEKSNYPGSERRFPKNSAWNRCYWPSLEALYCSQKRSDKKGNLQFRSFRHFDLSLIPRRIWNFPPMVFSCGNFSSAYCWRVLSDLSSNPARKISLITQGPS